MVDDGGCCTRVPVRRASPSVRLTNGHVCSITNRALPASAAVHNGGDIFARCLLNTRVFMLLLHKAISPAGVAVCDGAAANAARYVIS
jgi:hypothetical protein